MAAAVHDSAARFRRLALTEAWERFSLHGVKALLTLYVLTTIIPGGIDRVAGLAALRRGIEAVSGTTSDVAFASQLYGLYGALSYLALPFGGYVADRLRSRHKTIVAGGVMMAMGHVCLTQPASLLAGLALLIVGTACLKGNLAAEVGAAHPPGDPGRDRAFLLYLGFLNIGAMLGPLVCGLIAQQLGWSYAFGAAAAGMVVALAMFLRVPRDHRVTTPRIGEPEQGAGIGAALVAVLSVTLCFCAYEQLTNVFLVWARETVDLRVGGVAVPTAWLAAADGLFTIMLVIIGARLWPWLARRGMEPSTPIKLALGCAAAAAAYGGLALLAGSGGRLSLLGPLGVIVLLDIGIVLAWPAALALITAAAPPGQTGVMVGIFYLHGFVANLVVGRLGGLYGEIPVTQFWFMHAAIAGAGALVALAIRGRQATITSVPASASA